MTDHHALFDPLPDPRAEALAAYLHLRWQEHEAVIAEWTDPTPTAWADLQPDVRRGYRAIALAAMEQRP